MSTQASADKPMKHRSVVSSFIFKLADTPDGKPQVALFRRSDKVSTYQHHLAPISGSIESDDPAPLSAAWREISEETTLTATELVLLRRGKPYSFSDPSIGRSWTIHPFGFALRSPDFESRIAIDWEHTSWSFHDPLSVVDTPEFGGVPRLAESLRRVWFEKDLSPAASATLSQGLRTLATDHKSGARQLAGTALAIFQDVILDLKPLAPTQEWYNQVLIAAWHLYVNGRPSMSAPILSALLKALRDIQSRMANVQADEPWYEAIRSVFNTIAARRDQMTKHISESLAKYLAAQFLEMDKPLRILTISQSSTLTSSLLHLSTTRPLEVNILESRPLFEGVAAAQALESILASERHKHKITVFTDAEMALASRGVRVVLLGADRIAETGDASNKMGSLPMVLSAKHVTGGKVKVVVVGDGEKIALPGGEDVEEENDGRQVSSVWGRGLEGVGVRNVFFEWVDAGLMDAYVMETGEIERQEIGKRSRELGEEENRVFEGL
ncbi:hypothetical protein OQA88_2456 [Cercophora sp. LCS_1]